jgi:uncharacterized membrane protein YgcG
MRTISELDHESEEQTMNERICKVWSGCLVLTATAILGGCGRAKTEDTSTVARALNHSYQVGPTRSFTSLQAVAPLLQPGDEVDVDYSSTPYAAGIEFTQGGTEAQHVLIHGVPDASGRRPVIKAGVNAPNEFYSLRFHADYYDFENFEIDGSAENGNIYDPNNPNAGTGACVLNQAGWTTLRNVYIHDCPGHGLLGTDTGAGSLTVEFSEVTRCGGGPDQHWHMLYPQSDPTLYPGAVFRLRYSYIHDPTGGNLVKSRVERNEIYYNWLESSGNGQHALQLIGRDYDAPQPVSDSDVVGNVIYVRDETSDLNPIWVGMDGSDWGTRGGFRFVNNTIVAPGAVGGVTAGARMIQAVGQFQSIEMHNNVFYRTGGVPVDILRDDDAQWSDANGNPAPRTVAGQNNWVETGSTVPPEWTNTRLGADPGFVGANDFHLGSGSPLIDAGTPAAPASPARYPFPNPEYPPHFLPPLRAAETAAEPRAIVGVVDIGAFEAGSGGSTGAGGSGGSGGSSGSGGTAGSGGSGGSSVDLVDVYVDQQNFSFVGGSAGDQAAVVAGQGVAGSSAIEFSNLQEWDSTPRLHFATPIDITAVQSTDKLRISLDVSAGRASRIYVFFNGDWQTYVFTADALDQAPGFQTFDIDLGAMRPQMGPQINDIYFQAGDGFPDNGTLWVDNVQFIRP